MLVMSSGPGGGPARMGLLAGRGPSILVSSSRAGGRASPRAGSRGPRRQGTFFRLIPAGRTGDGSPERLRRFGGILLGDAAVPAPLSIRTDRDPAELRRLARRERDGRVSARLLALADALDGLPREEAARLAGMTGQTLGDRVHRYNAEGVEGLRDRPRPGRPCALDEGRPA